MNRGLGLIFASLLALSAAATTSDGASIVVGTHQLLPDTPGQVIEILAHGGEMVAGLNFYASLGDGGPDLGGTDVKPKFTVDLTGPGLIFGNSNNTGQSGGSFVPGTGGTVVGPGLWASASITTAQGGAPLEGVLARITVDTTGIQTLPYGGIPFRLNLWDYWYTEVLTTTGEVITPPVETGYLRLGECVVAPPAPPEYVVNAATVVYGSSEVRNTVTVSNGSFEAGLPCGPIGRDDGRIANVTITHNTEGRFSISPIEGLLQPGSSVAGTVRFNSQGLADGTRRRAMLEFDTLPGVHGQGNAAHHRIPLVGWVGETGPWDNDDGWVEIRTNDRWLRTSAIIRSYDFGGSNPRVYTSWLPPDSSLAALDSPTESNEPLPSGISSDGRTVVLLSDILDLQGTDGILVDVNMTYSRLRLALANQRYGVDPRLFVATLENGIWEAVSSEPLLGTFDRVRWWHDHDGQFAVAAAYDDPYDLPNPAIPEPATLALLGSGALMMVVASRACRRRNGLR